MQLTGSYQLLQFKNGPKELGNIVSLLICCQFLVEKEHILYHLLIVLERTWTANQLNDFSFGLALRVQPLHIFVQDETLQLLQFDHLFSELRQFVEDFMFLCTVVQFIEFLSLPNDGIQFFLPFLILFLSFLQFIVQVEVLAFQFAINFEVLSFGGRVVFEAHGFHIIQLLLELNQGYVAEDMMEFIIKLLYCQFQSDHLLMWLLLLYLIGQFFFLQLQFLEKMLYMKLFLQQNGIKISILILYMGKLQDFPIHHLFYLFLQVCREKFFQLHIGSLINLFLMRNEP